MKKYDLSAFAAGLVFGLGLLLSGMANPHKVLAFLDLFGAWDPSLGLVMAGAIAVGLPVFQLTRRRTLSLLGAPMQLPRRRDIDRPLVIGSLLFGIGWGLAGFCPGPAIVASGAGALKAIVFTAAMLAGMGLFQLAGRRG
ncbi:YeeE/YedE family protein [Microbulbifer litoralis]|uniref:YeeE/YedE family protein n=1 Tax=Microbulbifer litoralis TaxID=2933965 RepID=UPI00202871D1|nr:YeeE/YedE family protein [Microbulbifer sp. GX H0434]